MPQGNAAPGMLALLAAAFSGRVDAAPNATETALPAPATSGSVSLEQAIAKRRSIRTFASAPSLAQIGQLLWAAQGITDETNGLRTAPSAGALYPLELYLAKSDGVFRYVPERHALARVSVDDRRGAIAKAAYDQGVVREAPAIVIVVGSPSRLRAKYAARAERFVYLEAGHAAQNLLLEAQALGLAATPVGAFDDDALHTAVGARSDAIPLYLIPFGTR
ncbi:MAG: SagB/ThcOx family dehydrogenase [Polyangiales bacterium]